MFSRRVGQRPSHLEIAQVLLRNGADACLLDFIAIARALQGLGNEGETPALRVFAVVGPCHDSSF